MNKYEFMLANKEKLEYGSYFISGDRDAAAKSKKAGIHKKAATYQEFRKMTEGEI